MIFSLNEKKLFSLLQQNERAAEFKNNTITPETRLILQQWMWSDYQLYNYFNHKLSDQIKDIGIKKVSSKDISKSFSFNLPFSFVILVLV